MQLSGCVGIVTGASRGIGIHIAEHLAKKGAHLALAARSRDDLEATAERVRAHGVRAVVIAADVTNESDLKTLVDETTTQLGPVDLLVNNAGREKISYFARLDPEDIRAIIATNVIGPQLLTRLVLPAMMQRGKGHIANIASLAGKTPMPYNAVYSATKHALVGFSHALREEVKSHGIGVSVVCPGFVSDAGMYADWSSGREPPGLTSTVSPEEVANATISAIEGNRAEVVVAPLLSRYAGVVQAVSPALTTTLAKRTYEYLEEEAAKKSQ